MQSYITGKIWDTLRSLTSMTVLKGDIITTKEGRKEKKEGRKKGKERERKRLNNSPPRKKLLLLLSFLGRKQRSFLSRVALPCCIWAGVLKWGQRGLVCP